MINKKKPSARTPASQPMETNAHADEFIGPVRRDHLLTALAIGLLLLMPMLDSRLTIALAMAILFLGSFLVPAPLLKKAMFSVALAAVAAIVIAAVTSGKETPMPVMIFIIVLVLLMIVLVVRNKNRGEVRQDERTIKIQQAATTYSWWITYVWMAMAYWLDYSGYHLFSISEYFISTLMVMLVSQAIIRKYLQIKGDA